MDRTQFIVNSLPSCLNIDPKSNIYKIINAITHELNTSGNSINHLDNILDIDKTFGMDLDIKWGLLLHVRRRSNEPDDIYKTRLKNYIVNLNGGTEKSIKYAISTVIRGLTDIDKSIQIIDGWDYNDLSGIVPNTPGHFVCRINIDKLKGNVVSQLNDIRLAVTDAKAPGTIPFIIPIERTEEDVLLDIDYNISDDISVIDRYDDIDITSRVTCDVSAIIIREQNDYTVQIVIPDTGIIGTGIIGEMAIGIGADEHFDTIIKEG